MTEMQKYVKSVITENPHMEDAAQDCGLEYIPAFPKKLHRTQDISARNT